MKSHLFTYIIGYRHRQDRVQNLKRVLDWLSGFGGIEIIIVEQDKKQKMLDMPLKGVKYVFTKTNLPYNRSWAFNVGLKYATTDVVAFGDSDLIMDPHEMISSLKKLELYDCVSPYKSVLDLNPQESTLQIEQLRMITRPGRGETDNQKINLCGGIVIYKKESIYKIGGWSEDFIGWGGEDNFQEFKTKKLLTWYEDQYRCYHLFHERGAPDPTYYKRTMELLNKYMNLNDQDLQKQIQLASPKIGLINKYNV
jgi:glycosyltransferase involved in cell wall biosynthesis